MEQGQSLDGSFQIGRQGGFESQVMFTSLDDQRIP